MLKPYALGIASMMVALSLVTAQTAAAEDQQPRFTFVGGAWNDPIPVSDEGAFCGALGCS